MRVSRGDTEISIIVPTLNEADNLAALVRGIDAALHGRAYEILIVDDAGGDDTPGVCERLRRRYPVFLHVRPDARDGLSGAVLYGLERARGEYLLVMDGDLQHPPERIPDLLEPLTDGDAEFVIGSRYVPGATTDGRWGPMRRLNSTLATVLARPFAGRTRDPMSGFFALGAETYLRAGALNPVGYKIGLELLCKCRVRRIREVPIRFGPRGAGRSKLTIRQRLRFLDHLGRLADFRFPRTSPAVKLFLANGCGWLIAFGLYIRLVARDVNPVLAPAAAFAAVTLASAVFQMRAIRVRRLNPGRAWFEFALVMLGQWAVCALTARWTAEHVLHASVLEMFLLTFSAAAIAGSAVRRQLTRPEPEPHGRSDEPTSAIKSTLRRAA